MWMPKLQGYVARVTVPLPQLEALLPDEPERPKAQASPPRADQPQEQRPQAALPAEQPAPEERSASRPAQQLPASPRWAEPQAWLEAQPLPSVV